MSRAPFRLADPSIPQDQDGHSHQALSGLPHHLAGYRPQQPKPIRSQMNDPPGPYESAILAVVDAVADLWWPQPAGPTMVGCPLWLVDRLSQETGIAMNPKPGAECELVLGTVRVLGSQRLTGMAGAFVVHDLISGWSYDIPLRCHRDLPPAAWTDFTTAISDGLTATAAADVVRFLASA